VRDTGIGIAQDKLPVFAAFAQADSSTARKYGGSGLGLAIVKRLVALMRGEVTIESTVGEGSTFSFTSPFEAQPDRQAAPPWRALENVAVLIVDNNQSGLAAMCRMLGERGATITGVASYEAALSAIRQAVSAGIPPRIVLLDDRIASEDSVELRQLTAAASQCGASMIAMIHCDNLAADVSRLRSLKLETYLVKPISVSEMIKALRQALVGEAVEEPSDNRNRSAAVDASQPSIVDRPLKILFADDSSDNRTLIRAFLKKAPYHLDEVENGRQAIDRFIAADDYDLVLMDIQMPEIDGYAATRAIRKWEQENDRKRTPIIALTASVFGEAVRLTQAAGCDAHVAKPISKAALLRAIYDAVAGASQA
jgi:CheY-like chemotaxis protein